MVIAEAVLGVDAERLVGLGRIDLAESALHAPMTGFGDVELYPDFAIKAAVLCARIVKNHPLPDGNKRVGYLCLLEFIERNRFRWLPSNDDPDETVQMIEGIAAGAISEYELTEWVKSRLKPPGRQPAKRSVGQ